MAHVADIAEIAEEAVHDVSSWAYRGEGSANIVLSYSGSHPRLAGKVLRLTKQEAQHELSVHDLSDGSNDTRRAGIPLAKKEKERKMLSEEEKVLWSPWREIVNATRAVEVLHAYKKDVLRPLLGEFVRPGICVRVTRSFLVALSESIRPHRPQWRVEESDIEFQETSALLISDFTKLPLPMVVSHPALPTPPTICIEIKPKCGFCPSSPAISSANSVKASISRFRLHQVLKYARAEVGGISEYDPLDLFSSERARVISALTALFRTPQNNVRVFCDGRQIFGGHINRGAKKKTKSANSHGLEATAIVDDLPASKKLDRSHTDVEVERRKLEEGLEGFVTSEKDGVEWFCSLVADCLEASGVLRKLLAVQMLDRWDIEGAIHAFNKMKSSGRLLELSSESISDEALRAAREGGEERLEGLTREDVLERINSASVEECVGMVRDYLISATAKDCGMMLAMQQVQGSAGHGIRGTLPTLTDRDSGIEYQYRVALIDLDLKPLKKMPKYFSLDQEIVSFYNKSLSAGDC